MSPEPEQEEPATPQSSSTENEKQTIVFENVNYSVNIKRNNKKTLEILKNVSGAFVPGKLSALMGRSGAGKTTLLDILAGRKNTGTVATDSTILFNGQRPTLETYRTLVGYVEQFDTLVGELTVAQMLQYTAALKLPRNTSAAARTQRVHEVISMLDLQSCQDTVIGNALRRGISGGQAKRVNIGLALTYAKDKYLGDFGQLCNLTLFFLD